MKRILTTAMATALVAASSVAASAQVATPIYDKMAEKDYGERFSLEQRKLCVLALQTYDYGVKELGLDKADSKKAVRAEKALPFVTIGLKTETQTQLLFDRAVAEIKPEFAAFKNADAKTQKKLFSAAKNPNKTCAKPFDNTKLEGYRRSSLAANYVAPMSSEDALVCMSVALNSPKTDRSSILNGFLEYITWEEVYKQSVRREGLSDDQLVEEIEIKDARAKASEVDEARALTAYETCPAAYKKAKFQADLKKDEPAEVPVINWD